MNVKLSADQCMYVTKEKKTEKKPTNNQPSKRTEGTVPSTYPRPITVPFTNSQTEKQHLMIHGTLGRLYRKILSEY